MAQFRRFSSLDFRMVQYPDGHRYQSPVNRISARHPFATDPSRIALRDSDYEPVGDDGLFHLNYARAAFIHEGAKNLQYFIVSAATGYNPDSNLPLNTNTELHPDLFAQLNLCAPPFFPPIKRAVSEELL